MVIIQIIVVENFSVQTVPSQIRSGLHNESMVRVFTIPEINAGFRRNCGVHAISNEIACLRSTGFCNNTTL